MTITQPTHEEVRAARRAANLTQGEAANLVHLGSLQRWAEYEKPATDKGHRNIDTARWELFLIKTGQHAEYIRRSRKRAPRRRPEDEVVRCA